MKAVPIYKNKGVSNKSSIFCNKFILRAHFMFFNAKKKKADLLF
jgi:hypothetical protein